MNETDLDNKEIKFWQDKKVVLAIFFGFVILSSILLFTGLFTKVETADFQSNPFVPDSVSYSYMINSISGNTGQDGFFEHYSSVVNPTPQEEAVFLDLFGSNFDSYVTLVKTGMAGFSMFIVTAFIGLYAFYLTSFSADEYVNEKNEDKREKKDLKKQQKLLDRDKKKGIK